jgi:osmoprotectant transport system substrate-binding protein
MQEKITATESSETKIVANIEKLMIEHYTNGDIKPIIIVHWLTLFL